MMLIEAVYGWLRCRIRDRGVRPAIPFADLPIFVTLAAVPVDACRQRMRIGMDFNRQRERLQ